jgi:outer membrane immunogenic protein
MKKIAIVLAASAAIFAAAPASASDQPIRYQHQQQMPYSAPYSWQGWYLGGHVLYGWTNQNTAYDTGVGVIASDFRSDGIGAGISTGYNWQVNRWVFGLDGTINWNNVKGSGSNDFALFGGVIPGNIAANGSLDYSLTFGPRIGIALGERNQWMPYFGAGWAYGKVSTAGNISILGFPVGSFDASDKLSGWYLEAGLDYRINRTWSMKFAYQRKDLGNLNFTAQTILGDVNLATSIITQEAKFGLTAHF